MNAYQWIAIPFGLGMLFIFGGGLSFVVVPWWLGVFNASTKKSRLEAYILFFVPVALTWVYDLLITFRLTDTGFTVNVGPLVLVPAVMLYSVKLLAPILMPAVRYGRINQKFVNHWVGDKGVWPGAQQVARKLKVGEKVAIIGQTATHFQIGPEQWVIKDCVDIS